jgi:hypothetical protein
VAGSASYSPHYGAHQAEWHCGQPGVLHDGNAETDDRRHLASTETVLNEQLPEFLEENRRILQFKSRYPFFHLDPAFLTAPGQQWWRPRLARLVDDCGFDAVAHKLMVVQFFPYHSKAFRPFQP